VKVTQQDTAYVCFGDTITPGILLNGIGQSTADLPSCLLPGYILHSSATIPTNLSTITPVDTAQSIDAVFVNNGSGNGSFGNPNFNQIYYLSPAGDVPASWGDFSCISSTVEPGIPVVFLQNLNAVVNYDNATCTVSFSATGGLSSFSNQPYTYTITNPLGGVVQTGNLTPGATLNYTGSIAGIYTLVINDGSCPRTFTFDASNCGNPCEPVTVNVSTSICQGASILLGGQIQTLSGVYTDVFTTPAGCDSTIITTLTVLQTLSSTNQQSICPGTSVQIGTSTYTSQGVYTDVLQSVDGCDSVVTTVVFMLPYPTSTLQATVCEGGTYFFGGFELTEAGVYQDTVYTPGSCDTIKTLVLTVENCEFLISNLLTPNGDGQNDTWKVSDPTVIAGCTVKIYNRWGQPVYETVDYNNEWGGTKNDEDLPDGVYFYSIKCDNKEYTGSINLLRFKK
jgi:gliding motility-associated-like protein